MLTSSKVVRIVSAAGLVVLLRLVPPMSERWPWRSGSRNADSSRKGYAGWKENFKPAVDFLSLQRL